MGFDRVLSYVLNEWVNDIKKRQIPGMYIHCIFAPFKVSVSNAHGHSLVPLKGQIMNVCISPFRFL